MMNHASPPIVTPRWFVIGLLTALLVAGLVASLNGGLAGLLTVGEDFPIRDYILEDFDDIQVAAGAGHDGQQYYGIARDPFARGAVPDLLDQPGYRYLHILYPAVAGGLGLFSPDITVVGMVLLASVGFGLAAGAAHALGVRLGDAGVVAAALIANVGLLMSVRFLTPDALALGLALVGVTLALDGRERPALAALALAALTKTPYLVFALAVAGWHLPTPRRALRYAVAPAVPLLAWLLYLTTRVDVTTAGNLDFPFFGFVQAWDLWPSVSGGEVVQALVAAVLLVGAALLWVVTPRREVKWLLAGWIAVAVLSSELVWEFGNNTLRVFAPLWTLGVVALGSYLATRSSRRNLPV